MSGPPPNAEESQVPPGSYLPPGFIHPPPGGYPPQPGAPLPPSGFPPPGFPPPGYPPPGYPPPPGFPGFPPPGFSLPPGSLPPPGFPLPPGFIPPPGFPPFSGVPPPPAPPPPVKKDMLCVFFPKTQNWYFLLDNMSWNTNPSRQFYLNMGNKDDIPVPGNYVGDGLRIATWRKGKFYIKGQGRYDYGATQGNAEVLLGKEGDVPVPEDYVGDGTTRMAVFRGLEGRWLIKGPGLHDWVNTQEGNVMVQCGTKGDVPVPADYYGEGKPRLAVFRNSPKEHGVWYIKGPGLADWNASSDNVNFQCGTDGDIPVPADYFGEGKVRAAVFRPKINMWYIKGPGFADWEGTQGNVSLYFGKKGDIPCPGDFFGEGKVRIAVYRPSDGRFYIKGPDFESEEKSKGNLIITLPESHGVPVVRKWDFK